MTCKKLIHILKKNKLSSEEIFFVLAVFVDKNVVKISEDELNKYVPLWSAAVRRRNRYMEDMNISIYDEDLDMIEILLAMENYDG